MDDDTRRLLAGAGLDADAAVPVGGGSLTPVLRIGDALAKHYRPGFDDYSGLGPSATAAKTAGLALTLPVYGIPVPRVRAHLDDGTAALVVWEAVDEIPFTPDHRIEAARVLRRLHGIAIDALPAPIGALVSRSAPNRGRIRRGVEESAAVLRRDPAWRNGRLGWRTTTFLSTEEPPARGTLVHGDYFSANLLAYAEGAYAEGAHAEGAHAEGVAVVDWDLASLGDPMWDLGFLVGADRDLDRSETEDVLDAYGRDGIDEPSLTWHRECWALFWLLSDKVAARG